MAEKRRDADFYPTSPCAMYALRDWLTRDVGLPCGRWLDPAAGAGSALAWLGVPRAKRYALELRDSEQAVADLARFVDPGRSVVGIDSLTADWGIADNLFANPPFALLDDFVLRIIHEHERLSGIAIILTPTQWWQAQRRRGYTRPAYMLPLNWRVPFKGAGAAMFDTTFCIFDKARAGKPTEVYWLDKPGLPRVGEARDPVWDEFDSIQPIDD